MSYENTGDSSDSNGGASNGNGNGAAPVQPGADTQGAKLQVVGQYVKDLSFENPGAGMSDIKARPQIDLGVDLQAGRVEGDRFEVELKLRVSAKAEDRAIFLLELIYCGVFMIQNVPEEILQQVLLIEGPHLLFPFARRVVADVIRDGGMPPLMIEPIDFNALYQAKAAETVAQRAGGATQISLTSSACSRRDRFPIPPPRRLRAPSRSASVRREGSGATRCREGRASSDSASAPASSGASLRRVCRPPTSSR